MIVTVSRYRTVTLDTTSTDAAVTGVLPEAQRIVEEHLDRWLEHDERTETLRIDSLARVWPKAIPVTACSDGTIDVSGRAVRGSGPDEGPFSGWSPPSYATSTITYSGGYLGVGDPAATDTTRLPATLERAICMVARALMSPPATVAVGGAESVSLGDASVSWGDTPSGGTVDDLVPGLSTALKGWKRVRP